MLAVACWFPEGKFILPVLCPPLLLCRGRQAEMADRAEVARREKERLKAMEKYKREQLEKLKQDGDATASEGGEPAGFGLHGWWPWGVSAHVRGAEDGIWSC